MHHRCDTIIALNLAFNLEHYPPPILFKLWISIFTALKQIIKIL